MSGFMIGSYEVKEESLQDYVDKVNSLTNDEVFILQSLPLDEVANEIGYTGSLEKFEFPEKLNKRPLSLSNDAIKLVCLFYDYNPSEARCFLLKKMDKQFTLLRDEFNLIKEKISEQMNNLGGYYDTCFKIYRRITVDDSTPKASKDDMARGFAIKEISPQYAVDYAFSPNEVLARLYRMFCYNKAGESIVIRPVSKRYRFIVLRNISEDNYEKMLSNGYGPNFVVRESWNFYSAVFVVPAFYFDDIFNAIAIDLAEEFEALVDDSVYVVGMRNFYFDAERRGKFPVVETDGSPTSEISDVMRNFIQRTMRRKFDSIQSIKKELKESKDMVQDRDIGEVLYVRKLDCYYSSEEIHALISGNGEHSDGNVVCRDHFSRNVYSYLQKFRKKFCPIVDSPLFSDPKPLISFEEDEVEDNAGDVNEAVTETLIENETSSNDEESDKKPKTLWGRIFK